MKFEDINRCDFLHVGGIYILKSKIDDRKYIGSAKSFYNRLINHRCALLGGYHKGVKLSNFVKKSPPV